MLIKDVKGMYEIEVNTQRGVVFEKMEGFWNAEDVQRHHQEYVTKIVPAMNSKKWAKCVDLRNYKTSSITEEINKNMAWCAQNGLAGGAIVVDSAIVKMQMNRSSKGMGMEPTAFDNIKDADAWLKDQGF